MIPLARRLVEISSKAQMDEPRVLPIKRAEPGDEKSAEQKLKEAYEHGRVLGRLEERKAATLELEEQKNCFDRELETRRAEWTANQGTQISQQLAAAIAGIEERLADSVAKVLQPFIEAALCRKAVDDFCLALNEALRNNAETALTVTGPQDLLDAIAAKLESSCRTMEFVASASCEVSARLGTTVFETQLSHWRTALNGNPQ